MQCERILRHNYHYLHSGPATSNCTKEAVGKAVDGRNLCQKHLNKANDKYNRAINRLKPTL